MKKYFLLFFITSITLIISEGCSYDKESILYPENACDTLSQSFSNDIFPIINNQCVSCHSGTTPSGGFLLNSHSTIKVQVTNGKLIGSIKHISGYSSMPKNSPKLSDCNIERIQAWINQGTLNN